MPNYPIRDNYSLSDFFDYSNFKSGFEDQEWGEVSDEYDDSFGDLNEFGCCFPDYCLMPDVHLKNECYQLEMFEA